MDLTATRPNPLQTDREPQPQPALIDATLHERPEEILCFAGGQSTTLVLHIDQDPSACGTSAYRDVTTGAGELESILNQVRDD